MGDLRVGVIGLGLRGGLGVHANQPGQGSCVVAICDVDPATLEAGRRWYGGRVATVTDYRQLLNTDIDAVMVCTPDHTHEELACAGLEAGKATYVEQPLALSEEA